MGFVFRSDGSLHHTWQMAVFQHVHSSEERRCCDARRGQPRWVQSGSVELRSAWHHDYPRARAVILRIA
jgi:hypothetical protein